jgi:uncharacterized protein YcbX
MRSLHTSTRSATRRFNSTGDSRLGGACDLAAIHVLTTATLNRLRELYPQDPFEVRRFRPNIVVRPENDDAEFENRVIGTDRHPLLVEQMTAL